MRVSRLIIAAGVIGMLLVSSVPAHAAVVRLETTMTGGGAGDPDGTGSAEVRVNRKRSKICYTLTVSGITLPATMAHIHWADDPTPPDVVAFLEVPVDIGGGVAASTACVHRVKRALITGLRRHPEQYYVNVHNEDYPSGAVTGFLAPV